MEINVKTALMRHNGKPLQIATGFVDILDDKGGTVVDDKGNKAQEPILEDLRLGVLIIEALSMQKKGEHIGALDIVKRDVLARRVYEALDSESGSFPLTSDQQTFLKKQIELLVSQANYSVFAAASALQLIAPDDFKAE
jgi:hypothetical protein